MPRGVDRAKRRPRATGAARAAAVIPARRRWGQHFLAAPETAERIVGAAGLDASDTVFEVGPGEGALTRAIRARGARVLAVEIDPRRAELLSRELAGDARVALLRGDVLERPFAAWLAEAGWSGRAVLLSNLPYNVATPVLCRAIEEGETIARSVATVQREVALRFAARPGSEGYGYLSIRAAAFARARILFDLPPSAFRPRPRVLSSVLELAPAGRPIDPALRARALALASLGFRSRRKTLANALVSAAPRAVWEGHLAALGKPLRARAEELGLEDYLELARRFPGPGAAAESA